MSALARTGGPADRPRGIGRESLVAMRYSMKLQGAGEDRIVPLCRQGWIVGGVPTGRGQEAKGAGSAIQLGGRHIVFPSAAGSASPCWNRWAERGKSSW